jgi:hypothetical protein
MPQPMAAAGGAADKGAPPVTRLAPRRFSYPWLLQARRPSGPYREPPIRLRPQRTGLENGGLVRRPDRRAGVRANSRWERTKARTGRSSMRETRGRLERNKMAPAQGVDRHWAYGIPSEAPATTLAADIGRCFRRRSCVQPRERLPGARKPGHDRFNRHARDLRNILVG